MVDLRCGNIRPSAPDNENTKYTYKNCLDPSQGYANLQVFWVFLNLHFSKQHTITYQNLKSLNLKCPIMSIKCYHSLDGLLNLGM